MSSLFRTGHFQPVMFVFLLYCVNVRFPKNRLIAVQWNAALGIDSNKFVQGLVCAEHFEDKYFKRKNKTELKPDALPTIFTCQQSPSCDQIVPNIASYVENVDNSKLYRKK